jgi:predicted metal-dependent phosphoesterase TrpH
MNDTPPAISPPVPASAPRAPSAAGARPAPAFADLHLHTLFSDGTFSPEELAGRGARCGLAAMSLTDHDTVEGCPRMALACRSLGIQFMPGAELTAELDGCELHVLGYFLDLENAKLRTDLKKFQAVRQDRIREMVARLNRLNIPLRAETVFTLANCHSPGRPHVGRALVQEGFCASLDEAFDRFLKKGRPAHVPKFKISALEAIALIHQAGGLASMAHPGLNRSDEVIPALAASGLDGLECFHSKHTPAMTEYYLDIAARHHLLVTGGSDCHGYSKGKPLIGGCKLPAVYFDRLKARHQAKSTERTPAAAAGNTP